MAIEATGTILDKIVAARRVAVEHRKRVLPQVALRMAVERGKPLPVRDFAAALGKPGVSVITEVKKTSPSRGLLRADFRPAWLAEQLERAGASAISILTEEEFFQGALDHLKQVRSVVSVPVLRKDFVFDPWQVWESRASGADSFLLIAAVLDDALLAELLALGRTLGMEPLVEVHTRAELDRAIAANAAIIGVNNRDLHTFDVRLETSTELIEQVPDDRIAVSESGLRSAEDIKRLAQAGFDAFLIGEQLMTADDPGAALRALLGQEAS